ncbi:helix-turn-helix transcriptional regulator [Streptomyces sp. SID339]|uniref:helix-turn-helix domain-containing protein n=1 Tax=unclassified Streptomyces TaxID=2593676 RepID=UPI001369817F|nr:helix-turn-helix domain-containing protein [Streptomyces sp. SID335]MYZ19305.1 helix-turn-helix domain-containing protein [Streptomyces sp. SID337]NDZ85609.1 helix-turn-helix domain-containing protein [Streptomyces sp. SID10115]NEB48362.1 helix-turn-helix domain-containing protein [Streptomyces sp. SID339]
MDEVAEFAALLRGLKERTDRSYGSLARRLGMNTSTLHRYCAGDAVPLDFAPVERFAALCGATPEERLELHRRWLLAVAARRRPRGAEDRTAQGRGELREEPPPVRGHESAPETTAPRPWYRRRRLMAGLASACAVLATLGAFSLLPDGRRVSADGPDRVAGAPERRGGPSGPSGAPASEPPTDSAASKKKAAKMEQPGKKPSAKTPGGSHPPGATSAPPSGDKPAAPPLTWTVDSHAWKLGCGHDYVVAKPPSQVPPPPAPQDAVPWAATQKAVHGGETLVRLSVQGRSDTAVVLEALRVRVVGRAAPVKGNAYRMDLGCGGAVTPRMFAVDLDKDRPIARAVPGNDTGTPIPAVRMPYRVSAKDPEVLLVDAGTRSCDCRWYLELDWSSQGRQGTVRVDDGGRPFRTSAIKGLLRYGYDTIGRRWGTYG